jgi:hypothetical protein
MGPTRRQAGFTLVEALVAAFILLVGALGTVAMVSAANHQTARTMGEESASNLAREVVEVARHVPFSRVQASDDAAAAIRPLVPGSGELSGPGWSVTRENRTFAVTLDACRVLVAGAGGCTTPSGGPTDGIDANAGIVIDALGLLGVDLTGGVPNALCGVFGPQFDLTVLGLAGVSADTCAQLGSQASLQADPPRLARLTVTVSWDDNGRAREVAHSSLVVDPLTMAAPR